jgi:hypothetical protein
VVSPIHNEFGAAGDGAEFADDQLVPDELIMMSYTALEGYRLIRIIIIGEVSHNNVGTCDCIFDETDLLDMGIGMDLVRVRANRMHRITPFLDKWAVEP